MLRNIKNLRGYVIRAIDGTIGKVDDFYFDDEDWGIRYLVVDTGSWLSGRKVLISPVTVGHAGWMARRLPVALTRAQVEHSPDIDTRKPVSRQHEAQYLGYYGYPNYWGGAGLWGMGAYPGSLTAQGRVEQDLRDHGNLATPDDCHLRSSNAVVGHHIRATDGDIGHLEDLLVDDRHLGDSLPRGEHEQLVGRPPCARVAGMDHGRELARVQRVCRSDSSGRQRRTTRTSRRQNSIASSSRPSMSTTAALAIGSPSTSRRPAAERSASCGSLTSVDVARHEGPPTCDSARRGIRWRRTGRHRALRVESRAPAWDNPSSSRWKYTRPAYGRHRLTARCTPA